MQVWLTAEVLNVAPRQTVVCECVCMPLCVCLCVCHCVCVFVFAIVVLKLRCVNEMRSAFLAAAAAATYNVTYRGRVKVFSTPLSLPFAVATPVTAQLLYPLGDCN